MRSFRGVFRFVRPLSSLHLRGLRGLRGFEWGKILEYLHVALEDLSYEIFWGVGGPATPATPADQSIIRAVGPRQMAQSPRKCTC